MEYGRLSGLPKCNGVTILGDRRFEDYGLIPMTEQDIMNIYLEEYGYVL